jgi:hypothetical protein
MGMTSTARSTKRRARLKAEAQRRQALEGYATGLATAVALDCKRSATDGTEMRKAIGDLRRVEPDNPIIAALERLDRALSGLEDAFVRRFKSLARHRRP